MKIRITHKIAFLSTLILTSTIFPSPAPAITFDQQEIEQNQSIAIARPYGGSQYDLLILQQIAGQRQCWSESGSNPTIVEPLLLNFDFTGSCERSTDSNGYSIRLDGQDYGLDYLLRLVKRNGELVLVGTHRSDARQPEIVLGRTQGLAAGFLKIYLDPGWRFTRRVYQGKVLSHTYLTGDSSAIKPSQNEQLTVATDSQANSTGTIREITITAGEAQPTVRIIEPEAPTNKAEKASQQATAAIPPAPPTPLSSPFPKALPTSSAAKTPLPPPPVTTSTLPPVSSGKTLPPPPVTTSTLPPAPSGKNPPSLPSFSQLPPLPPPSSVGNTQVVPPPLPKSTTPPNRKTLSHVLAVSPRQAAANNPDTGNLPAGNRETARLQESYCVMVQADNRSQQEQLRSLYPDAFQTRYNGQSLWQIGVFNSRDNADSALQSVQSFGLQGKIVER